MCLILLVPAVTEAGISDAEQYHVVGSGLLGYGGSWLMNDRPSGFWLAMAPGVMKEAFDKANGGEFSGTDIGYNAIGAFIGCWLYTPTRQFGFDGQYAFVRLRF